MLLETVLKARGSDVATLEPTATLAQAAELLAQQHIQIVLVCSQGRGVIGVLTDSDILGAVGRCADHERACCLMVSDLMTRDVVTCHREDRLDAVLSTMMKHGLRRIPVVERDGTLAGLITMREALLHLYEEARLDGVLLKEYFLGVGYH